MNKVITIKAWRRPDYYQQVISALEKCPGIDDYIIYTVVDHTDPQYGFLSKHTYVGNKSRLNIFTIPAQTPLGCAGATRMCLEVGFNGTDNNFIIHSKTTPSPQETSSSSWSSQTESTKKTPKYLLSMHIIDILNGPKVIKRIYSLKYPLEKE